MTSRGRWLAAIALALLVAAVLWSLSVASAQAPATDAQPAGTWNGLANVGLLIAAPEAGNVGEDGLLVDTVYDGRPAALAGIQKGDRITQIYGAPIAGLSITDVAKVIAGGAGTEIKLTLQREGQDAAIEASLPRQRPGAARLQAEAGEAFAQVVGAQGDPGDRAAQMRAMMVRMTAAGASSLPSELSVEGQYVYVVRGYMLYQFKVQGLELVDQYDLRTDQEKQAMEARAEAAAAAGGG
jgi:membrane-associated protease RseP (regulator of RpoE activity)